MMRYFFLLFGNFSNDHDQWYLWFWQRKGCPECVCRRISRRFCTPQGRLVDTRPRSFHPCCRGRRSQLCWVLPPTTKAHRLLRLSSRCWSSPARRIRRILNLARTQSRIRSPTSPRGIWTVNLIDRQKEQKCIVEKSERMETRIIFTSKKYLI